MRVESLRGPQLCLYGAYAPDPRSSLPDVRLSLKEDTLLFLDLQALTVTYRGVENVKVTAAVPYTYLQPAEQDEFHIHLSTRLT